jgi:hypothetical protein
LSNGYKARRPAVDLVTVEESASELGLQEALMEVALEANGARSGGMTRAPEMTENAVIESALDRLVHAMKQRSALAPAVEEIRPEMSIKKQVALTVNAMKEKDPVGSKVIESAVDVLVQAMKLRRTSSVEL